MRMGYYLQRLETCTTIRMDTEHSISWTRKHTSSTLENTCITLKPSSNQPRHKLPQSRLPVPRSAPACFTTQEMTIKMNTKTPRFVDQAHFPEKKIKLATINISSSEHFRVHNKVREAFHQFWNYKVALHKLRGIIRPESRLLKFPLFHISRRKHINHLDSSSAPVDP